MSQEVEIAVVFEKDNENGIVYQISRLDHFHVPPSMELTSILFEKNYSDTQSKIIFKGVIG